MVQGIRFATDKANALTPVLSRWPNALSDNSVDPGLIYSGLFTHVRLFIWDPVKCGCFNFVLTCKLRENKNLFRFLSRRSLGVSVATIGKSFLLSLPLPLPNPIEFDLSDWPREREEKPMETAKLVLKSKRG